jgi:Shikimate 5-dehydrogenase
VVGSSSVLRLNICAKNPPLPELQEEVKAKIAELEKERDALKVYCSMQTPFLKSAADADATTIGGLEMPLAQGAKTFELWTGKKCRLTKSEKSFCARSEPPQR